MEFYATSLIAVPIGTFPPVIVIIYPTATRVSLSLRSVIFSFKFNICDVVPESAINVLLSCSWFDIFVINSSL